MATERQRARFRSGVGDTDSTVWTDGEIDDLFTDALDAYPSAGGELQVAHAVRAGIEAAMADSSKRTSYTAGATSEDASDIFKALEKLHKIWDDKVNALAGSSSGFETGATQSAVRWGPFKGLATSVEVPDA